MEIGLGKMFVEIMDRLLDFFWNPHAVRPAFQGMAADRHQKLPEQKNQQFFVAGTAKLQFLVIWRKNWWYSGRIPASRIPSRSKPAWRRRSGTSFRKNVPSRPLFCGKRSIRNPVARREYKR